MIGPSPRIISAIEGFAESIGAPPQKAPDGSFNFLLERSGTLSFTPTESGDRLLVSLAQKANGPEAENELRLFARAGFDLYLNKFLHSGLSEDGSHVHVIEFSEREVDLQSLVAAAQRLIDLFDE